MPILFSELYGSLAYRISETYATSLCLRCGYKLEKVKRVHLLKMQRRNEEKHEQGNV